MYADRHARPGGFHPGSLGIAIGINAAIGAALMFINPEVRRILPEPPLTIFTPVEEPIPEPLPSPSPTMTASPQPREVAVDTVDPVVKTSTADPNLVFTPAPPQPPVGVDGGEGTGTGTVVVDPPRPPLPVLVPAGVDPRYAGAFQPPYPPAEQRAGRVGRVTVRVLIGVDGRVKQVEPVSATSDDFLRVTRERALSKWRFTPATRDGVPVEGWKVMTVRFELQEE